MAKETDDFVEDEKGFSLDADGDEEVSLEETGLAGASEESSPGPVYKRLENGAVVAE